ncbi:MAG: cytochrome c oxidase accessory protein CcoG [Bacteroidota bacterium]
MPDPVNIQKENFRDSIATIDGQGKRKWIYPSKPKGKLYNLRKYFSYAYLLIFFGLPFIKVAGAPLFLFNIIERKFILFGMIFWPQDFFIFGLGMLIFIVFIALFTVIFGRVFCGWACPQTVFMEMLFRRIEYWIMGDANQQKALKRMSWNSEKITRFAVKYILFFVLSFVIANTFLCYIIGLDEVIKIVTDPLSQHTGGLVSILVFTSVFFFIYSWFREQVCIIMCPYGRMQGVLLDKESIIVAYDYIRGEPRHKYTKDPAVVKGDCIDCGLCVKVCPTGIDIRNGTQLECVNCTACIDACDHMMESVKYPTGLIRFDSEKGIAEKKKLRFTTRMKAYSIVLLILVGIEATLLATRSDYDATVLRAKGMLYQERDSGQVSNLFTVKFVNKTRDSFPVELRIENLKGRIEVMGKDLSTKKEAMSQGEFFVYLNKSDLRSRKTRLIIGIYSNNKKIKTVKTNFLGPVSH